MNGTLDVVVVGGGAAGLSAALVLGRARRRTLVIDAGGQSNLAAHGIGGLLGHDGRAPGEFYKIGRRELGRYPSVEHLRGLVSGTRRQNGGFELTLADGSKYAARRILLAAGMEYRYDALPGMDELWGTSVFHCPFCHGWEVNGKPLAVWGKAGRGLHGALLLRAWSDDVILLTGGPADLDRGQLTKLEAAGVKVEEREIERLVSRDGVLSAIGFSEGQDLDRSGLLISPRLHQRSSIAASLGVRTVEDHMLCEDAIEVDSFCRTTVPGVFAAGDQAGEVPQVASSVAMGSKAGASIVQDLLGEDFGLPLPA